jgi:molecular chaperone GrpE
MTESQTPEALASSAAEALPAAGGAAPATGSQVAAEVTTAAAAEMPPSLEDQLAVAKKEAAAIYDRYLRAVADLENFRRRGAREKDELRQFGATGLLQSLLPALDNLQLALAAARQQAEAKTIADGVAMVLEQWKGALERHGLKEVNPTGQKFDPHLHESLAHRPDAEVPEEHVVQVVRIGYTLNGRLLRPAAVVLSGGPAKEAKG